MIDWGLAEQIAAFVAGSPPRGDHVEPQLRRVSDESARLVGGYTGLEPAAPLPAAEALDRPQWINANVRSLRAVLDPVTDRMLERSAPLRSPLLRGAAGLVLAAEVGVVLGFLSQRVLGQYELVLIDADAPSRLLFVEPNIDEAIRSFGAEPDELVSWVALHEVTHALQFGGVPWLRDYLGGLLRELLEGVEVAVDSRRLLRLPTRAGIESLVAAVRSGDLLSLVTTPEQRTLIDRIQAAMALIEGYAEHVMDAVGLELLPTLPALRAAMDRRRRTQSPAARLIGRLLGLELKLRQYELGKRFCDEVVAEAGIGALNRAWTEPGALPELDEISAPSRWLARTR